MMAVIGYIDGTLEPDKMHWPDLVVFTNYPNPTSCRLQMKLYRSSFLGGLLGIETFLGGHGGLDTRKVALLIHGPGIANVDINSITGITLVDILPTICSLIGWDIPA